MKIVQCWDDGVEDDIRLIEILRKHGAKASFNLNWATHFQHGGHSWNYRGREVRRIAIPDLKPVYDGFLVANHSLSHPHLEQIAPEEAAREIQEGRDKLEQHFGYEVTGFVYPFGTFNDEVKDLVRQSGHVYARTAQKDAFVFPPPDAMEFAPSCHFGAPDFWDRFERAGEVFYLWGHSYELVSEEMWADLETKIERLTALGEWMDLPELFAPGSAT